MIASDLREIAAKRRRRHHGAQSRDSVALLVSAIEDHSIEIGRAKQVMVELRAHLVEHLQAVLASDASVHVLGFLKRHSDQERLMELSLQ